MSLTIFYIFRIRTQTIKFLEAVVLAQSLKTEVYLLEAKIAILFMRVSGF